MLMFTLLMACDREPWEVTLVGGTYESRSVIEGGDTGDDTPAGSIVATLDVDAHTFVLTDGTDSVAFDYLSWGTEDWPTGCPMQTGRAHEEAASLTPAGFTLGNLRYDDVAIFALCPEGGGLGVAEAADLRGLGEGEKCGAGTCVYFDPERH